MSDETFALVCRPQTLRQVRECTTQGSTDKPHAVHRELTPLAHYLCNCGYSSGWVPEDTLPLGSDFIAEHAPSADIREMLERCRA